MVANGTAYPPTHGSVEPPVCDIGVLHRARETPVGIAPLRCPGAAGCAARSVRPAGVVTPSDRCAGNAGLSAAIEQSSFQVPDPPAFSVPDGRIGAFQRCTAIRRMCRAQACSWIVSAAAPTRAFSRAASILSARANVTPTRRWPSTRGLPNKRNVVSGSCSASATLANTGTP